MLQVQRTMACIVVGEVMCQADQWLHVFATLSSQFLLIITDIGGTFMSLLGGRALDKMGNNP